MTLSNLVAFLPSSATSKSLIRGLGSSGILPEMGWFSHNVTMPTESRRLVV